MQILTVVVRYGTSLEASPTLNSLGDAFEQDPELLSSFRVLLWDNGPEPLQNPELPFPFTYKATTWNVGLSGAFNSAAAMAEAAGVSWMLLLDQDTTFPADFLPDMLRHAVALEPRLEIAAIVPTVYVVDFVVSPRRMLFNRHRAYPEGECGIAAGEAAAINSGTLLRVKHLLEVGGYSHDFWLDYSDWYVFHQLFLHSKLVWRAADLRLQHSMTVMDYDNLMTPGRYSNFLAAEGAFNDIYKGRLENAVQTLRLFVRTIKQRLRFKDPAFSRLTWQLLVTRLFTSRQTRIAHWQQRNTRRDGEPLNSSAT